VTTLHVYCFPRSRSDVANIVASAQAGRLRNHGLTPGSGLFYGASRLALASTEPPIQWVLGIFLWGYMGRSMKVTMHH